MRFYHFCVQEGMIVPGWLSSTRSLGPEAICGVKNTDIGVKSLQRVWRMYFTYMLQERILGVTCKRLHGTETGAKRFNQRDGLSPSLERAGC